jgi:hypothetical protein
MSGEPWQWCERRDFIQSPASKVPEKRVTTDADNGNWAETDVSSIERSTEARKYSRGICKRLVELQHAPQHAAGPARQLAQIQKGSPPPRNDAVLVSVEQGVVLVR